MFGRQCCPTRRGTPSDRRRLPSRRRTATSTGQPLPAASQGESLRWHPAPSPSSRRSSPRTRRSGTCGVIPASPSRSTTRLGWVVTRGILDWPLGALAPAAAATRGGVALAAAAPVQVVVAGVPWSVGVHHALGALANSQLRSDVAQAPALCSELLHGCSALLDGGCLRYGFQHAWGCWDVALAPNGGYLGRFCIDQVPAFGFPSSMLGTRDGLQVRDLDAPAVPAGMVDFPVARNRAVLPASQQPMCLALVALVPGPPVAVPVVAAQPLAAAVLAHWSDQAQHRPLGEFFGRRWWLCGPRSRRSLSHGRRCGRCAATGGQAAKPPTTILPLRWSTGGQNTSRATPRGRLGGSAEFKIGWSMADSNRRPLACQLGASPCRRSFGLSFRVAARWEAFAQWPCRCLANTVLAVSLAVRVGSRIH